MCPSYQLTVIFYFLVIDFSQMKMGIASGGHFLTLKSIEVVKKADRKLTFIPVVFILLRMWGTIRFFRFLAYHPENPPALKWLVILHISMMVKSSRYNDMSTKHSDSFQATKVWDLAGFYFKNP